MIPADQKYWGSAVAIQDSVRYVELISPETIDCAISGDKETFLGGDYAIQVGPRIMGMRRDRFQKRYLPVVKWDSLEQMRGTPEPRADQCAMLLSEIKELRVELDRWRDEREQTA